MKKGIWAFVHSLLYPLIYILSQIVASVACVIAYFISDAMSGGMSALTDTQNINSFVNRFTSQFSQQILIASCLITLAVILLILKIGKKNIRETFRIRRLPAATAAAVFVLGIAANMATSLTISILPIPEDVLTQYEKIVAENVLSDNVWLTVLVTALLVPLTEEVVFRGMSFNILRKGMPLVLAVIFQTLIFAGAHMLPLQIAYVIPTALLLGLVYVWCGSFVAPLLLHIAFNGVSAAGSFLTPDTGKAAAAALAGEAQTAETYIMIAVSFFITGLCLFFLYRRRDTTNIAALESAQERGIL